MRSERPASTGHPAAGGARANRGLHARAERCSPAGGAAGGAAVLTCSPTWLEGAAKYRFVLRAGAPAVGVYWRARRLGYC